MPFFYEGTIVVSTCNLSRNLQILTNSYKCDVTFPFTRLLRLTIDGHLEINVGTLNDHSNCQKQPYK